MYKHICLCIYIYIRQEVVPPIQLLDLFLFVWVDSEILFVQDCQGDTGGDWWTSAGRSVVLCMSQLTFTNESW